MITGLRLMLEDMSLTDALHRRAPSVLDGPMRVALSYRPPGVPPRRRSTGAMKNRATLTIDCLPGSRR